jgi:hypothetical protein
MTTHWNPLTRYAAASNDVVQGIDIRVRREPKSLTFQYVLRADTHHVRVPSPQASMRTDELWKHTCFEAFISTAGGPGGGGYYELNFSPSSQWAIYRFSGYRQGMSPTDVMAPPELAVRQFEDRLELDATIGTDDLVALREAHTLKLAVTAVIEDDSGTLSYWALKHAPVKPDFHHTDGFVLELPK